MGGGGGSVPPAYRRDFANIGLDGYVWQLWGRIIFNGCVGCGRMETFDLGVRGAMPSTLASLLNAVTGIRWPSSGAFAVLAVIRDLGSQEQRGMALKDRRIHLCSRQTICGPYS